MQVTSVPLYHVSYQCSYDSNTFSTLAYINLFW